MALELHIMVRLQFWKSVESRVLIQYHVKYKEFHDEIEIVSLRPFLMTITLHHEQLFVCIAVMYSAKIIHEKIKTTDTTKNDDHCIYMFGRAREKYRNHELYCHYSEIVTLSPTNTWLWVSRRDLVEAAAAAANCTDCIWLLVDDVLLPRYVNY